MSEMSALWLGIGVYVGTAALGTAAQLRLINTHPFRWVHHIMFAMVWLTLVLALLNAWPHPWLLALIAVAGCMAILPRFRAGTRPHCLSATIGLVSYIVAVGWALLNAV